MLTIKRACSSSGVKRFLVIFGYPLLEECLLCIAQALRIEAACILDFANSHTLDMGIEPNLGMSIR